MKFQTPLNAFAKAACPFALAAVTFLAVGAACRADDASSRQRMMENRFLIVVDSSSAMKSRTNGVEEAVAGLLGSAMHGEFRKGDTLGVWTYNEDIHADFPMRVWSPGENVSITADVLRFLRHEHYEKRAHLEKVLHAISPILAASDRLTIVFIYDGSEPIRGTPFDGDINDLQKKYIRQFHTAHMPMVTILAARYGQVFDYTINYPNAMTVPHTAIDLPPPETNAPPAVAAAPAPVAPQEPAAPHRRIEIVMAGTNGGSRTLAPGEPETDTLIITPANAATVAAPQTQFPLSTVVTSPPADKPQTEPQQPAVVAQVQPAPAPAPQTAPTATQVDANPTVTAPAPAPPQSPPPAAASVPAPAPSIASTSAMTPTAAAVAPPAAAQTTSPAPLLPASSTAPPAAMIAAGSTSQQVALFIIAFSLLTIAVVLVIYLLRRSRADSPSLITQSIDRGR